jgi:hypothetical protein
MEQTSIRVVESKKGYDLEPIKKDPNFLKIQARTLTIKAEAEGLDLNDAFQLEYAGVLRGEAGGNLDWLEKFRLKITKPMNAYIKAINALFASVKDSYEETVGIIDGKIREKNRLDEKERERIAKDKADEAARLLAQREVKPISMLITEAGKIKIEEEKVEDQNISTITGASLPRPAAPLFREKQFNQEQSGVVILTGPVDASVKTEEPPKSISEVTGGMVQVKHRWTWRLTDFSKVPDEYKILDESKLTKLATNEKEEAEVPGIEFYREPIVSGKKLR